MRKTNISRHLATSGAVLLAAVAISFAATTQHSQGASASTETTTVTATQSSDDVKTQAAALPFTQPAGPRETWSTETSNIEKALSISAAKDGSPLTDSERRSVPVQVKEMTAAQAGDLLYKGLPLDDRIAPDRIVRVVSVHAFVNEDGNPMSTRPPVVLGYTMVFDAPSGWSFFGALGQEIFPIN